MKVTQQHVRNGKAVRDPSTLHLLGPRLTSQTTLVAPHEMTAIVLMVVQLKLLGIWLTVEMMLDTGL